VQAGFSHRAADNLLALQRGLTGERRLAGTAYMDDPQLALAYTDYYLAASKAQVFRILSLTGLRPRSVLDLGAGPGSVSLALADSGATSFTLVDSSASILEQAKKSLAGHAFSRKQRYTVSTLAADLESPEAIPSGPFDLVAFGHCLNEVGDAEDWLRRRLAILERAAAALTPTGKILIMDPATLKASRETLALRDALAARAWSILVPCTFRGPCPALAGGSNHTCHDEASWSVPASVKRLAEKAGLDRGLIKMTWFLLRPPSTGSPGVELYGTAAVHPGEASTAGHTGDGDLYRVVSSPMLNKGGRIRYLICGAGGRFPFSARKDDPAAAHAGFFSLERYDLLRIHQPELREGGWGFGPETTLKSIGNDEA